MIRQVCYKNAYRFGLPYLDNRVNCEARWLGRKINRGILHLPLYGLPVKKHARGHRTTFFWLYWILSCTVNCTFKILKEKFCLVLAKLARSKAKHRDKVIRFYFSFLDFSRGAMNKFEQIFNHIQFIEIIRCLSLFANFVQVSSKFVSRKYIILLST